MAAGVALLERKDYRDITMDEVAREARVAKGTPYLYFPTKEKLFTALAEDMRRRAFEAWDKILRDSAPGLAALKALVRYQLDFFERHKGVFLQVLRGDLPTMRPGRDKGCAEMIGRNIDVLERALRDARRRGEIGRVDPNAAAVALFGIVRGFVFSQIIIGRGGGRLTERFEDIWRIFQKGVQPA